MFEEVIGELAAAFGTPKDKRWQLKH